MSYAPHSKIDTTIPECSVVLSSICLIQQYSSTHSRAQCKNLSDQMGWTFSQCLHRARSPPYSAFIPKFRDILADANPFGLDTNAFDEVVGAVLPQRQTHGMDMVIAYASKRLNKRQRNRSTMRKEILTVLTYVRYFRNCLMGKIFIVLMDHLALRWLLKMCEPVK